MEFVLTMLVSVSFKLISVTLLTAWKGKLS
jgi:hypothetical protein